jgi:hypothetical protein
MHGEDKAEPTESERCALEQVKRSRRDALEEQWRQNGCVKDSSGNWTVPYHLIWRSLPRGEDR